MNNYCIAKTIDADGNRAGCAVHPGGEEAGEFRHHGGEPFVVLEWQPARSNTCNNVHHFRAWCNDCCRFDLEKTLRFWEILGASWAVMRVRELGRHVLVADYNEDRPTKAIVDEGGMIYAMDVDSRVDLRREKELPWLDRLLPGVASYK